MLEKETNFYAELVDVKESYPNTIISATPLCLECPAGPTCIVVNEAHDFVVRVESAIICEESGGGAQSSSFEL